MDYHDKGSEYFNEERTFLQVLEDVVTTQARWNKEKINQMRFIPIEEMTDRFSTCEELGLFADTQENTKLYMDIPEIGVLPVGNSALVSICQRAKISGAALWKMSNEFLVQLLNECFSLFGDNATLYVSLGKVRAAHSDHYKQLDMTAVFRESTNVLKESLEQVVWKGGYIDHSCAMVEYEIKDDDLLEEYKRLLKTVDLKATVKVVSSNTGDSGANISYGLVARDRHLLLANTLKMNHKGDCSLERFSENMGQTFSQFRAAYKNFYNMQKFIIMHPNSALYEAMTKQHISKKLVAETVELRKALSGDKPCDALTLYLDACEVLGIAQRAGINGFALHDLSEKVSRLACADWTHFDHAAKKELLAA